MAMADAPCHDDPVRPDVTNENEDAATPSSVASPSHAAAACRIGSKPAPKSNRAELISGGSTAKLIYLSLTGTEGATGAAVRCHIKNRARTSR
jgi:hypothetical protein